MNKATAVMVKNMVKFVGNIKKANEIQATDQATMQWNRKTAAESLIMSDDDIWTNRYFLDWNDLNLLGRIRPDMISTDTDKRCFGYFINWRRWTRVNAFRIDGEFFRKWYRDLDLLYVFNHRSQFPLLNDSDLEMAVNLYTVKKASGSTVYYLQHEEDGITYGIPIEHRNNGRVEFGHAQLAAIHDAEAKKAAGQKKKRTGRTRTTTESVMVTKKNNRKAELEKKLKNNELSMSELEELCS